MPLPLCHESLTQKCKGKPIKSSGIYLCNILIIQPTPDQNHWIFKPEAIAAEILLSLMASVILEDVIFGFKKKYFPFWNRASFSAIANYTIA